jgi:AcrR family transcriptional regulator
MPRVINPEEYQQKRGEILDAATRLIYTKGYEQMSIQDILDELSISKGAFYHYFDSKQALLEAIIERMMAEVDKFLRPIVQDPNLPTLEKLERFFDSVARWKTARKAFMLNLLRVWYADHNALVRQKLTQEGRQWMSPYFSEIIRQGVQEGVLDPGLNEDAAEVVLSLMISMGENIAVVMLSGSPEDGQPERMAVWNKMVKLTLAYRRAIERVLGAPDGSIMLFDLNILQEWVLEPDITPTNPAGSPV